MYGKYNIVIVREDLADEVNVGGVFLMEDYELEDTRTITIGGGNFNPIDIQLDDCDITEITKQEYNFLQKLGLDNLRFGYVFFNDYDYEGEYNETFRTSIGYTITEREECEISDNKKLIVPSEISGIKVTAIGHGAFDSANLESVELPDSIEKIGSYGFCCNYFTTVIIPDSVDAIGNFAFSENKITELTIPNSVKEIGYKAFEENKLTNIKIPSSVIKIGAGAFRNNYIESVTIPSSVIEIGVNAFSGYRPIRILGKSKSEAERYAERHNVEFIILEEFGGETE